MKFYSNMLNKEIELETIETVSSDGTIVNVISNHSLNEIARDNNINYTYTPVCVSDNHNVIQCEAYYNDIKTIGIGETFADKLIGISGEIPTKMAYKRAFDSAIINILGLTGKCYSDNEIINATPIKNEKKGRKKKEVAEVTSTTPAEASEIPVEVAETITEMPVETPVEVPVEVPVEAPVEMPEVSDEISPDADNPSEPVVAKGLEYADELSIFSKRFENNTFAETLESIKFDTRWIQWVYTCELKDAQKIKSVEKFREYATAMGVVPME